MLKPTIVQLEHGTTEDGYTFKVENNRKVMLKCWFDGEDILLEGIALGRISIGEVIHLICGLFHRKSNFKKLIFHEYSWLKPKRIRSIGVTIMNYNCVIIPNSNPDEIVREYYRFQGYEVCSNDLEEDIVMRHKNL